MSAKWSTEGLTPMLNACVAAGLGSLDQSKKLHKALKACPVLTFYVDGAPVGAAVFVNNEPHIGINPEFKGRWLTPQALRMFRKALAHCKRALIRPGNAAATRFALRMGWKPAGQFKGWDVYAPV